MFLLLLLQQSKENNTGTFVLAAFSTWNSHWADSTECIPLSSSYLRTNAAFTGRPPLDLRLNETSLLSLLITLTLPWTYFTCSFTWHYFCFLLICLPQQQRKYVEGEAWQSFSTSASAVLRRASGYLIYICLSKEEKKSKKKGWEEERKEEKTDNRKRGVRKKKEATERNLSTAIWVILDMSFHIFKPQCPPR